MSRGLGDVYKRQGLLNKVIDLERKKNSYFVNLSHELRTPSPEILLKLPSLGFSTITFGSNKISLLL